MQAIEALPLVQTPEVFGLHANADVQYYTDATKALWRNLVELQPRTAGTGTGVTRDEFIGNTARDILQAVPHDFDLLHLRKELGVPSPTQVVLLQELDRWNQCVLVLEDTSVLSLKHTYILFQMNGVHHTAQAFRRSGIICHLSGQVLGMIRKFWCRVINSMTMSLKDVLRALAGEIGLSGPLEALSSSLFNGLVPAMWAKLNPETEKSLGSWMLWFQRRFQQYKDWINSGEPPVMWLSGLHIPETYIAALIQTACRQRGWPLDKSTLYTKVTKIRNPNEIEERPDFGCYVTGLFLEGAGWDEHESVLKRQEPKVLVTELPVMQIIPVEASKLKLANTFRCPVYVTQNRRNAMGKGLVMHADLASNEHESHWVLQGTALCLNTSD